MATLLVILETILRAILPFLYDKYGTGQANADAPDSIKDAVVDKIKAKWAGAGCALLAALLLGGCLTYAPRTVYVPDGEPVRLRQDVPDCKVWVMTATGSQPSTLTLKEGWYAVSIKDDELKK